MGIAFSICMSNQNMTPRNWLEAEFRRRKERNPRFSMRTFARQIGISPGRLSEILSGKRELTLNVVKKICSNLTLSPSESKALMVSVPGADVEKVIEATYKEINMDAFYTLADWQHFAIFNLMDVDDFQQNFQWIADRLNIAVNDAQNAVNRLIRTGLIVVAEGKWKKQAGNVAVTQEIASHALKLSHRQTLEQAANALHEVPLELRDITSITMAIDIDRIPEAREMIKQFRRKVCAHLEGGPKRREVYNLNVQLVPLTKPSKKEAG